MSLFGLIRGYRSSDATAQPLRLDRATNTIQTIDYAHHEIHAGSAFSCHYAQTAPTGVGERTMIAFKTPDTTSWIHMFPFFSSTAASKATVYETANLALDQGTDLAIYNRDRNSSSTSGVTTIETAAETGEATSYTVAQEATASLSTITPVYEKYLGAAAAGADTGGEVRSESELILKQNTQYAFVVENTTADDNTHNILLSWYEHTNIA